MFLLRFLQSEAPTGALEYIKPCVFLTNCPKQVISVSVLFHTKLVNAVLLLVCLGSDTAAYLRTFCPSDPSFPLRTPLLRHRVCQGLIKPTLRKVDSDPPPLQSIKRRAGPRGGFWPRTMRLESAELIHNHWNTFTRSELHHGGTQGKGDLHFSQRCDYLNKGSVKPSSFRLSRFAWRNERTTKCRSRSCKFCSRDHKLCMKASLPATESRWLCSRRPIGGLHSAAAQMWRETPQHDV